MMRLKGFAAMLLLAALFVPSAFAQYDLSVDTVLTDEYPNIKVNVITRFSNVITRDVDSSHFRLVEDGFVQEPLHFSCPGATESFSLSIVIGIGSTMSAGDISFAKGVASRIVSRMNGISDEVAVITYDDNVNLQAAFTHIPIVLQQGIDAITGTGRGNYFWDGVYEGVRYCANDGNRVSRGVLILSNGKGDGGSKNFNDVVQLAKLAKIPVYCLGISAVGSDQDMRDLAAQTGGKYFDNADQTVQELVDNLNGTPPYCTLEYTTDHLCRSGVDRQLDIRVRKNNDSASVTHAFAMAADPADRVPVTITVDSATVTAGLPTDVPLLLSPAVPGQRLLGGELLLRFDTSLLQLTDVTTDGYLAEGMQASAMMNANGAMVTLFGTAQLEGSGTLMMLEFTGGSVQDVTPATVDIDTLTGQSGSCLERAYPTATLSVIPKQASISTTAQPVVFNWDSGAKRYTPHPGVLTVEVTNDGDLPVSNLTATLAETPELRIAYGGSPTVQVMPSSLEPGKKGTATWYVQILPQSSETTAQVEATVESDEGATATQRLFVNIKAAESAFALDCEADEITVSGSAYTPDPAEVRAVVTAAGTADGPAGDVTIVLPPELTLESGDATQSFASMAPGNSETLTWSVEYPSATADYTILLVGSASGYPDDTCRVTLSVPELTAPNLEVTGVVDPVVLDTMMSQMTVTYLVRNTGTGDAEDVHIEALWPLGFAPPMGEPVGRDLGTIAAGDSVEAEFKAEKTGMYLSDCEADTLDICVRLVVDNTPSQSCVTSVIVLPKTNLPPEITDFMPAVLDTTDKDNQIDFSVDVWDRSTGFVRYVWYVDGNQQGEDTTHFSWTFDAVGMHEVKVEIYDPCTVGGGEAVEQVWSFFVRDPTGIADDPAALRAFDITGNYPNPFNPGTIIEYRVPDGRHEVRLDVIDAYGRVVRMLVDDVRPGGVYRQSFDADGLPSGTYIARLRSATTVRMHRMVLVK